MQSALQPIRIGDGPSVVLDDAGSMVLEENPEYDPEYVVDGLAFRVDSVRRTGEDKKEAISISLKKSPSSRLLFDQTEFALLPRKALPDSAPFLEQLIRNLPTPPPKSFPSIALFVEENFSGKRAGAILDGMRRNGEIVEREDDYEVGGIASLVARKVFLMQRVGKWEWKKVREVALA